MYFPLIIPMHISYASAKIGPNGHFLNETVAIRARIVYLYS